MQLLDNLAAGKLPSMDINTEVKTTSLVNIGLVLFVSFCMIFLAWYTFKKIT